MSKFGFIGIGNMGGALAMAASKAVSPSEIFVSSLHSENAQAFSKAYGTVPSTNNTIAHEAKFIVLGVKPQFMEEVLSELRPILSTRQDAVLVTMAAGLTMADITRMAGRDFPVIRIMPNTPVQVGYGTILYDTNELVSPEDLAEFLAAMKPAGYLDPLPERLIDAGSAVAGCGPAFACLVLEALADGGVACGLPRKKAMEYAAQMLLGSAQLFLETGKHPGELKDAVCSPGGSTIQGVRTLEEGGLRGLLMDAVIAAYEKNKNIIG